MIRKERRADDNGGEEYKRRRFFNNGTLLKVVTAVLIGAGGTKGIDFISQEDHNTIGNNKTEIVKLNEKLSSQEQIFQAKLETLNTKIDAVDDKIEILLRRTE